MRRLFIVLPHGPCCSFGRARASSATLLTLLLSFLLKYEHLLTGIMNGSFGTDHYCLSWMDLEGGHSTTAKAPLSPRGEGLFNFRPLERCGLLERGVKREGAIFKSINI